MAKAGYWLYSGWVAGFVYYDGTDVMKQLKPGQELQLQREPDNPYDGRPLKYMPVRINWDISR